MTKANLKLWLPVAINSLGVAAVLIFAFYPFHQRAEKTSAEMAAVARDVDAKVALLAQIPARKSELDSLVSYLDRFRSSLFRTDEVDRAMRAFEDRASTAGVDSWKLDPSLPTLVTLGRSTDSIAALNLALLPLRFEFLGDFLSVGRFLEAEEKRSQFSEWRRLTITAADRNDRIRAAGEIILFLLPTLDFSGAAS